MSTAKKPAKTPEELQAQFPSDIAEMPSEKPVETPAPTD